MAFCGGLSGHPHISPPLHPAGITIVEGEALPLSCLVAAPTWKRRGGAGRRPSPLQTGASRQPFPPPRPATVLSSASCLETMFLRGFSEHTVGWFPQYTLAREHLPYAEADISPMHSHITSSVHGSPMEQGRVPRKRLPEWADKALPDSALPVEGPSMPWAVFALAKANTSTPGSIGRSASPMGKERTHGASNSVFPRASWNRLQPQCRSASRGRSNQGCCRVAQVAL